MDRAYDCVGRVDFDVVPGSFHNFVRSPGRKMRKLGLHLIPSAVDWLGQVAGKAHLLGIV
jgi:hypothetical protein